MSDDQMKYDAEQYHRMCEILWKVVKPDGMTDCASLAAARIAELEGENAKMRDGLMRIRTCTDCPTLDMGDMRKGLQCGLEDRDIINRYEAAEYGFDDATERWFEWARNEADAALTPTPKEPGHE